MFGTIGPSLTLPMDHHLPDPVLRDSRWAAGVFAAGALLLLMGAALGMHPWPAEDLVKAAWSGSGASLFVVYHGYAMILVVVFWASRPSRSSQWAVFLAWPIVSLILWYLLRKQLPLGWLDGRKFPVTMFLATALSLPCLAALVWRCARPAAGATDALFEARLRWLLLLSLLFLMVPAPGLGLTAALHPVTFDVHALLWDRAAGFNFAPQLIAAVDDTPGFRSFITLCYGLTPLGFLAVALKQLRGRPAHVPSALLAWVLVTSLALLAYHLFPITGPKYVFGSDGFAKALSDQTGHAVQLVGVPPYPRNGMPSMHFGWLLAACILWWQTGSGWLSRAILLLTAAGTATATIYLGEHYVIDLVVAVPFVLAGLALASPDVSWRFAPRRAVVLAGLGIWLAWVLLLRFQIQAFVDQPVWCGLLLLCTAVVVILQVRWMRCFPAGVALASADVPVAEAAHAAARDANLQRRFGWLFFASGAAALAYQVLFAKELALVFGSTATATFTVLATFLGGMALGSLLGGGLANRTRRPLATYAFVELGIAVYCVLTPKLFVGVQTLYLAAAGDIAPDAASLVFLRVAMGALVLLLPTVLMGATLPLLAQALAPAGDRMGMRVAWLYFANTAGAAVGALLTAYLIIPALGGHRTTLIAAVLNLLVALGALELAKRVPADGAPSGQTDDRSSSGTQHYAPSARRLALLTLGVGGLLSLGLEVVYVHMLSIVAGNSVYAFGLMVATFLFGLSMGGEAARRYMRLPSCDPVQALAFSLLGLSATVAVGAHGWNAIPDYFASYAGYPLELGFSAREAIRGLVCAVLMVPPTLFIGAAYAFGMDIATSESRGSTAVQLGRAAAANTTGNIAGVLLFGFVLLPRWGGLGASVWIAISALALAALTVAMGRPRRIKGLAVAFVLCGLSVGVAQRTSLDYEALSSGANVYFQPQNFGQVIDHAESIDGGLTTVARSEGPKGATLTLLTNGKFQGNDSFGGEMQAQIGFAMAPLLHTERRDRALVIGYGTGVTSRVLSDAGFKSLEIAELSGDIVRLADRHFSAVNDRVSSRPGVRMNLTDGRNLLLLRPDRYDLISIEITSIWFAGAASLYNKEFYQLARSRLQADGVLQQWVQLHRLSPMDILSVVSTLRSEFRYVSLYVMGGQGILVASNSAARAEPSPAAIERLQQQPGLAPMREVLGRPAASLPADRLLDPAGVDRLLADATPVISAWWSTDNNMLLEYQTPKANVNDPAKSYAANLAWLQRAVAPRP